MATWITVGAKGTIHIGDIKTKLRGATQRNSMNITDLRRQISFFKEMEADMRSSTTESDLDGPSRVMDKKLVRLQKAQEHTERTLEDIVIMVSDLTCGLSEI